MNKFENELKNGNFVISECTTCNQVVWPASDFCNICHNNTICINAKNTIYYKNINLNTIIII